MEENDKHVICRPRSVRIGKNCALGLEYGPRPAASGRMVMTSGTVFPNTAPGRQITYYYCKKQVRQIETSLALSIDHIGILSIELELACNGG